MQIDTRQVIKMINKLEEAINTDEHLVTRSMIMAYDSVKKAIYSYEEVEGNRIALEHQEPPVEGA